MSFLKYQAYKASGLAWLGDVPANWSVLPLKVVATCNDEVLPEGTDGDTAIEYVEISGVEEGRGITQTEALTFASAPSRARRVVRHGDVLISTVRTYLRAIATVSHPPENLIASTGFAAIRPKTVHPGFLGYLLHCEYLISEVIARSVGISYPGINASDLMRLKGPIPRLEEQAAIATFLDRETGKTDALVEEQRRLIELLKEKRQAVISRAVTKGLNPDVPMKDSGVEWLGKVPAHWGHARKLVDLAANERHSFVNGPFGSDLLTGELTDEGVPVVYIRDIKPQGYQRVSEWHVTADKAKQVGFCNVISGDIVIAKVGDPPGLAAIYPDGEPDGIVTQDVIRLRLDRSKAAPSYIRWLLNSRYGLTMIDDISVESTRTRVGLGEYKQLRFFVPPLQEQEALARHIDGFVAGIDRLVSEASLAATLLQERRSALISAAVTGKIDVRGLAPQPEAVAA